MSALQLILALRAYHRACGEMWPVSCGSAATGTLMSSSEAVLRVHA